MNRYKTALVLLFSLTAFGCGAGVTQTKATSGGQSSGLSDAEKQVILANAEVSDFILKDVDGRSHALSDYLGDYVILISFWATWCEPCKKEMVQLQELYDKLKPEGLMVLSISIDEPETQGDVRPFVKQRRYTYPVLIDTESQVTEKLNSRRAAPFNIIIDKQGKIAWSHEGYVAGDEDKLEKAVATALGKTAQ